jgi:hypothetical protein
VVIGLFGTRVIKDNGTMHEKKNEKQFMSLEPYYEKQEYES